jgi:LysM repeat protein
MRIRSTIFRCAALFLLSAALSGCLPSSSSSIDDEKDPHYINGRNRVSGRDFKGAMDEYEKALEANPRNSAAHRELGFVCGEQLKDYAGAIYHLQQYLKLRPQAENAKIIGDWIRTYKAELVKSDFIAPMNIGAQRDLERLTTENNTLKRQIEALQTQLGTRQVLETNLPSPSPVHKSTSVVETVSANSANFPTGRNSVSRETPAAARPRTYTVRSGDTVTSIAKQCRVKLNSLLQSNPSVDSRKLKVGQTLTIPAS